jgi:hypothetical protein
MEVRVTDNREVDRVEVFLDDRLVEIYTVEPIVAKIDISEFEEKSFKLRAMAYDREGNTAEAQLSLNHSHGLELLSPSGGEAWLERSTQTIMWERCGVAVDYVSLFYSHDGGFSWTEIVASTPNDGSYVWTLPDISETRTSYRVKVSCIDGSHSNISDGDFTVTRWNPRLVGNLATPGYPLGVFVSEGYAYVTDGYAGLEIIDISDPATPNLVGSYVTPSDRTWEVFVSGSYAYVADGYEGLHAINISSPSNPWLSMSYVTPGYAYGVFVSQSYAYVADGNTGLQIIEVSDPVNPSLAGSRDTPGTAYGISIRGSYAYIADGNAGLHIIDISNPENPILAGFTDTPDARDVFVSGDYAYVADHSQKLLIFNISGLP